MPARNALSSDDMLKEPFNPHISDYSSSNIIYALLAAVSWLKSTINKLKTGFWYDFDFASVAIPGKGYTNFSSFQWAQE
jgi:hypothetical protein